LAIGGGMTGIDPWPALLAVLRDAGVDRVLGKHRDLVLARLAELTNVYRQRLASSSSAVLPPSITIDDIIREHQRNPHRVAPILQALAFNCTPTMLAMMWFVQMGARVESIDYKFCRGRSSHLAIVVKPPDSSTSLAFESDDHWDLAVVRLAGLSKADEQPLVEAFYALAT
jgi:hypothetical protein